MSSSKPAAASASTPPPAPPVRFNLAQHLLARNSARAAPAAFVDERGRLSDSDDMLMLSGITATGRIQRIRLREREAAGAAGPASVAPRG